MRLLFIGDVVGNPGRRIVHEKVPSFRKEKGIDFVVANGENAAGGLGITEKTALELFDSGVDCITSGDHLWSKKEILTYLDRESRLLRPANFPPEAPGRGSRIFTINNSAPRITDGATSDTPHSEFKIGVLSLMGRIFIKEIDCPFRTALLEIERLNSEFHIADGAISDTPHSAPETSARRTPHSFPPLLKGDRGILPILVDFHAEATSEKIALAFYLDGKVSAVLGTHTHVQTADERILPKGTAYITDVGMTGPFDSVIGLKKEVAIKRFLTQIPLHYEPATEDIRLNGVVLEIDPETGKAISIERIEIREARNSTLT